MQHSDKSGNNRNISAKPNEMSEGFLVADIMINKEKRMNKTKRLCAGLYEMELDGCHVTIQHFAGQGWVFDISGEKVSRPADWYDTKREAVTQAVYFVKHSTFVKGYGWCV